MKKIIFLLLFTVSIYGQTLQNPTLQNPTFGIVTEKNNATDSTPAYFTTTQVDGVHKKTSAALIAKDADVLHTNFYPETKKGGLIIGGENLSNPNDKWVAFGTSVTILGKYTVPTAEQLNLTLLNYGISGGSSTTLAGIYGNIPTWTSEYRLFSIEHSLNDSGQIIPLATFRANIEACIANAKSKGWPNNRILIINGNFITVEPSASALEAYCIEAIKIAKEQGVQYYDVYNYTKNNGGGALLSDGVHPTDAGGLVYSRGLIASMRGGGEFTNGLSVVNGMRVGGIIKATKDITTSGKLFSNGLTTTDDINIDFAKKINYSGSWNSSFLLSSPDGYTTFKNGLSNGKFIFYTSDGVTNANNVAFEIRNNKDAYVGGSIFMEYAKYISYDGGWNSKFYIADPNGDIVFKNGANTGKIDFQVSNTGNNTYYSAFKINGSGSLELPTTPTTSAGTYDILTRNISTGVVEKVTSASVATTASPTFTGIATAPTATAGTNTTQIATTAFVQAAKKYKTYIGILNQSSTSAPTVTVIDNELSSAIVWTYSSVGGYVGTLIGAFTNNKTSINFTNGQAGNGIYGAYRISDNAISITSSNSTTGIASDGLIWNATIEVRVYN